MPIKTSMHVEKQTATKHWRLTSEDGADGRETLLTRTGFSDSAAMTGAAEIAVILSSCTNSSLNSLDADSSIIGSLSDLFCVDFSPPFPGSLTDLSIWVSSFPNCESQRRPSDDFRERGSGPTADPLYVSPYCSSPNSFCDSLMPPPSSPGSHNWLKLDRRFLADLRRTESVIPEARLHDGHRDSSSSHRYSLLLAKHSRDGTGLLAQWLTVALSSSGHSATPQHSKHAFHRASTFVLSSSNLYISVSPENKKLRYYKAHSTFVVLMSHRPISGENLLTADQPLLRDGPESYWIRRNNAKLGPLRRSRSFKVTDFDTNHIRLPVSE